MSIEAMKQALEALEILARYENPETRIQVRKPKDGGPIVTMYPHKVASDAAQSLRQAIEQAEKQEPVAWMWRCKPYCDWPNWSVSLKRPADSGRDGHQRTEGYEDIPLYTTPQPQRELVGLTDEEIMEMLDYGQYGRVPQYARNFVDAIEAKLKEKNT